MNEAEGLSHTTEWLNLRADELREAAKRIVDNPLLRGTLPLSVAQVYAQRLREAAELLDEPLQL